MGWCVHSDRLDEGPRKGAGCATDSATGDCCHCHTCVLRTAVKLRSQKSIPVSLNWLVVGPTVGARQRSCQQNAAPLQNALVPCVEVLVGLAAACDVGIEAADLDAVPSEARRARSPRCDMHMSACRCKNVQWSCLCSAMRMCVGVCTVGACVRVLARARVCVLRRHCRTRLPASETARPFPSCATTGPAPRARGHPPWRTVHGTFFAKSKSRVKRERSFSLYGHRKPGYGRSERSYGLSWTDIDRTR